MLDVLFPEALVLEGSKKKSIIAWIPADLAAVDASFQFAGAEHGLSDLPIQHATSITGVSVVNSDLGLV